MVPGGTGLIVPIPVPPSLRVMSTSLLVPPLECAGRWVPMFFFSEAVWSFQGLSCSLKLLAAKWSRPRAFERGQEGIPMYWFIQKFFLILVLLSIKNPFHLSFLIPWLTVVPKYFLIIFIISTISMTTFLSSSVTLYTCDFFIPSSVLPGLSILLKFSKKPLVLLIIAIFKFF